LRSSNAETGAKMRRGLSRSLAESPDTILCFSHLRWDFVFQRPQHLMSRFAQTRRVFFIEEPMFDSEDLTARSEIRTCTDTGVVCVIPHLPAQRSRFANEEALRDLLDRLIDQHDIVRPLLWYYTPAMLPFSRHIENALVVYDCMDELANFLSASPQLPLLERELMRHADVVFTGGHSLYEAKRALHDNIHPFPSSVDRKHFLPARTMRAREPADQASLPRPRLGYYGVLDERLDFPLIAAVADARPQWSIILLGPLAKIQWDDLPTRPNLHYLGAKPYKELPSYVAGWDVALMPFALNEATRFISPTKTPEYLASGKPVVSTPVTDVVRQYGNMRCVRIARSPESFISECEAALTMRGCDEEWLKEADLAVEKLSWDATFEKMCRLIEEALNRRASAVTVQSERSKSSGVALPGDG
jgi:UDP-galactopyranose mutase